MPKKKFHSIRLSSRDILFENVNFIAVHKRQGWLVHPSVDKQRPSVLVSLRQFLKNRDLSEPKHLTLVHRLDVDTSGVLLFSKTKAADKHMSLLMQSQKVKKEYLAVCEGEDFPQRGTIENFLKITKSSGKDKTKVVRSGGKKAITSFEKLESSDGYSLIRLRLHTGRKHQIRAHCADLGFPLAFDKIYGNGDADKTYKLHAELLEFDGLDDSSNNSIHSPCPEDFWPPRTIGNTRHGNDTQPPRLVAFHKPYGVLCQFTKLHESTKTLADFNLPKGIYPIGRLDKDSEGLVVLARDKRLQNQIAHPDGQKEKVYWVQIEGEPNEEDLDKLRSGIVIKTGKCLPCKVNAMSAPRIHERVPPIRKRASIPVSWIEVTLTEGKNRQIRKMTAAIGHPTLRLIRVRVSNFELDPLKPGEFQVILGI